MDIATAIAAQLKALTMKVDSLANYGVHHIASVCDIFAEELRLMCKSQEVLIKSIENQIGQIVNALLNRPQKTLPNDTEANSGKKEVKEQLKKITLRSGKVANHQNSESEKFWQMPSAPTPYPSVPVSAPLIESLIFDDSAEQKDGEAKTKKFFAEHTIFEQNTGYKQVDKLIFPADFVILDFEEDKKISIILGRPFLATGRTLINVQKGEITMRVQDQDVTFNVFNAMKFPTDEDECYNVDLVDSVLNSKLDQLLGSDTLERALTGESDSEEKEGAEQLQFLNASPWKRKLKLPLESLGLVGLKNSQDHLKPSIEEAPTLELKPLPDHLRNSGYNQISIAPEDQEKTTFTCPFGTFPFCRVSFGLCGAPATFQSCMMAIFSGMIGIDVEVFMDDFSVFGCSCDECLHNLSLVLKRCVETNLVLNWETCHFMVQQGIILGHKVSRKGLEVDKVKVGVIENLPPPISVKEIRSFLEKDVPFKFDEECLAAFETLKKSLTTTPVITTHDWDEPLAMMCDSSDFTVGVVLGQRKKNIFHVVYYACKTLNGAQLNYTTTEKELLAIVYGFEKFRSYLLGIKVTVYIDHTTIRYLVSRKDSKSGLIRWILLLQEFKLEIKDMKESGHIRLSGGAFRIVNQRVFFRDCHTTAYGGHYGEEKTAARILQAGFFWSTLFKDVHQFVLRCDRCQRVENIFKRDEMPLNVLLEVEIFDVPTTPPALACNLNKRKPKEKGAKRNPQDTMTQKVCPSSIDVDRLGGNLVKELRHFNLSPGTIARGKRMHPRHAGKSPQRRPAQLPSTVTVVMRRGFVDGRYLLGLPRSFCESHLPDYDDKVVLVCEDNREYITEFSASKCALGGHGWKELAGAKNLVHGDAIVLEKIMPLKLKVCIRKGPSSLPTSLPAHHEGSSAYPGVLQEPSKDIESGSRPNVVDKTASSHQLATCDNPSLQANNTRIVCPTNSGTNFFAYSNFKRDLCASDIFMKLEEETVIKYFELCCSQKIYLHSNLVGDWNPAFIAATI
ncbi:hypothetical protein AgCh_030366 [Apium graveolens]